MLRRTALTLLALVAFFAAPAFALDVGGVKLDDRASVGGKDLVLNGAGIRTKMVFKVYVASLYVPAKTSDAAAVLAAAPRRVQLNLLRNLSADQLVEALIEGLNDNNTPQEMAAIKAETDQLVAIMKSFKDVKEKDVVALDYVDGGTKISFNGEPKGAIAGEPFNSALMKVWLGNKPVQPDLKKALLGG